ncbi:MAG: hypothetical protein DME26_06045 [Verrucomicrobia bacterium]|nr:MAG: hypothetical protein DME26_06045 [Verrucomicrobiota bacterium]
MKSHHRSLPLTVLIPMLIGFTTSLIAQPSGLISWWQGEGNVLDSVGSNNGALNVPLSYTAGQSGQAFSISGGIVQIPDSPSLDPSNVTVQAWVRATAPGTYRYVICKAGGAGGVSYALYTGGGAGLIFFVNLASGGGLVLSPSADGNAVWDGNWHLATGVFDGTTAHLYVDGVEIGSGTSTANTNGIDYSSPQPLLFGDYQIAGGLPYAGLLDEVKVFGRALDSTEALETYNNANSPAGTNGLVSWYKAEQNALDSWGTNNGSAPLKPFVYTAGRAGQCFFPQGGDALIPDSLSLQPSNVTVQAWVKSVAPASYRYLVCKARGAGGVSYALYTGGGSGLIFFVNRAGGAGLVLSPAAAPDEIWDGAWHLATGAYDGNTSRLYIDGTEVGSGTDGAGEIDYSSPKELVFGDYQKPGGLPFIGEIDDIKIYDHALSSSEILGTFTGTNLVGWWRAETNANDSVGGNNGTTQGTVTYVAGRRAGSAFHTSGGVVSVPDSTSLRVSNLTVQAFVSALSPGANKYILCKSANASSASYALYTGPSGGLTFYVSTAAGAVASPTVNASAIWDGFFHFVDGTFDGQTVRLYVDGKEVGSGTSGSGPIQYGTAQNSGALLFGDFYSAPGVSNFVGSIDEIKIYNYALSASEIDANTYKVVLILNQPQSQTFTVGSTVTLRVTAQGPAPLLYQWQFFGTNLPAATNSALVLSNVQPAQAGPYNVQIITPTLKYTAGVSGQAFQLGSGGLVRIANAPAFETQQFSVQCWARAVNPGTYRYLFSKSRDPSYYSSSYGLYTADNGGLKMFVVLAPPSGTTAYGFITATIGTNIWDGAWHLFTGTWDGQFVSLYVDGDLAQSVDSFGGTIDYQTYFQNGDLLLGDVIATPGPFHFNGDMDGAKFFDHALSPSDVLDTFTNPNSAAATTGLLSWWRGESNTLDSLGNNNGTAAPAPGSLLSSTAILTVAVVNAVLTDPGKTGNNFQATVTGPTGQSFIILRSADLNSWTPVVTNTVPFTFTDPLAPGSAARFYRAVSQN